MARKLVRESFFQMYPRVEKDNVVARVSAPEVCGPNLQADVPTVHSTRMRAQARARARWYAPNSYMAEDPSTKNGANDGLLEALSGSHVVRRTVRGIHMFDCSRSEQRATCSVQRAACSVQCAACSVQRAACSVQLAACSVQRAARSVQPAKRP